MNMHLLKAHKQIIQPNKNTLSCHWGFKTKTTKEYFHKKRLKNNHHWNTTLEISIGFFQPIPDIRRTTPPGHLGVQEMPKRTSPTRLAALGL